MENHFFIWGAVLFALLVNEKIVAIIGVTDPVRRVILLIGALIAILFLLAAYLGLKI